jgi:hypothetical protein
MIRQRTYSFLFIWVMALGLLNTIGCAKKCQPPETEKIKSVTAFPWRLVESTDPQHKGLNNVTFLIFQFQQNMTGDIKKVTNNTQQDDPIFTFIYNISPEQGVIRAKFAGGSTGSPDGTTPADTSTLEGSSSTNDIVDLRYELSRQFEMTDISRGYYYRFVPFKGIINPDEQCEF